MPRLRACLRSHLRTCCFALLCFAFLLFHFFLVSHRCSAAAPHARRPFFFAALIAFCALDPLTRSFACPIIVWATKPNQSPPGHHLHYMSFSYIPTLLSPSLDAMRCRVIANPKQTRDVRIVRLFTRPTTTTRLDFSKIPFSFLTFCACWLSIAGACLLACSLWPVVVWLPRKGHAGTRHRHLSNCQASPLARREHAAITFLSLGKTKTRLIERHGSPHTFPSCCSIF
ncbi:hypothetical protein IWZ01DRAFT_89536 [Phyllosticta capitalensis]